MGQFLKKFLSKIPSKKEDVPQNIFRRLGPFDYQEQFTNAICGKYVAETFNFMFMSKIKFPF
jgi:hypothetical protein